MRSATEVAAGVEPTYTSPVLNGVHPASSSWKSLNEGLMASRVFHFVSRRLPFRASPLPTPPPPPPLLGGRWPLLRSKPRKPHRQLAGRGDAQAQPSYTTSLTVVKGLEEELRMCSIR